MNVKLSSKNQTTKYEFAVEHKGQKYNAVIHLSDKGKFIDEEIYRPNGGLLQSQGAEGQILDEIIDHLDANWEVLTK